MLRRLAEADAGIEHDAVAGDAGAFGERERAGEEGGDVGHDVDRRIGGLAVVHDDDRHGMPGDHGRHVGIALQAPHVVDDAGAGGERQLRHLRLHGVDRYRHPEPGHRGQHRLEALRFLARGTGVAVPYGRVELRFDIDDVRTLRHDAAGMFDGGGRIRKRPPSETIPA